MQALFALPYKQLTSTVQRTNILSPAAARGEGLQQHQTPAHTERCLRPFPLHSLSLNLLIRNVQTGGLNAIISWKRHLK